ncbi:DegT/DnrJ/EryC1/StrS family aminotransferase [Anaeromassilibacillus senegalensis]|uniref:DegT/DnrJ/EryC1/StrS family aminotransferase n=1 Tax=Anaeromassilibacillus senegalensis TaxID=1673717 RepID=UPI002E1E90BF
MHREIYVTRPAMPLFEEYCAEIRDLWNTRRLTNMGEKHRELEVKLKAYLHAPHLTLFANGHLALESAIGALGLSGEIITTPFTFASTTHAIVRSEAASARQISATRRCSASTRRRCSRRWKAAPSRMRIRPSSSG